MKAAVGAGQLVALLHQRYEERQGWLLFEEVRNGTGYREPTQRYADAIALQTFPSRGICAHGFEVKVARSDLVSELRQPTKAEAFQKYCEYWWLVVPEPSFIDGMLIPETWGVLAIKRGKLAPVQWKPAFVAAVCRAFQSGMVSASKLAEVEAGISVEVARRVDEGIANTTRARADEATWLKRDLEHLKEHVAKFEAASGVSIANEWNGEAIGAAVKAVRNAQFHGARIRQAAKALAEQVEMAKAAVGDVTQALDVLTGPEGE